MSKFIDKDTIEDARKIDLLTYLKQKRPDELVKVSADTYSTKTHDSVRISNGLWHRFSTREGGRSAIDYLIKVENFSFQDAVEEVLNGGIIYKENEIKVPKEKKEKQIIIPKKAQDYSKVIEYLIGRGIDEEIINYCIINNLIYQEDFTNNVVFLGYDNNKNIKFACIRSTNEERIMRDAKGSSKEYSFRILSNKSQRIHLFESAIDLLSYATLLKQKGVNWLENNLISLSGVYQTKPNISESKIPITIENFLNENANINEIILHFDNDKAGRNATNAFLFLLGEKYKVIDSPAPIGKDINDYLCFSLGLKNRKQIEKYKEFMTNEVAR